MKSNALALVVLFGFAGSAFANQEADQTTIYSKSSEPNEIAASDSVRYQSTDVKKVSAKAPVSKEKSLKERERERKGLPRYWN